MVPHDCFTAVSSSTSLSATGTGVVHYVGYPICLNGEIMTPFLPPSTSLLPYINLIHLVRSAICKDICMSNLNIANNPIHYN